LFISDAKVVGQDVKDRMIVVQVRNSEASCEGEQNIYLALVSPRHSELGTDMCILIDIENCGGFFGSQRQFGGVHVKNV
jgi:hypothetical protein